MGVVYGGEDGPFALRGDPRSVDWSNGIISISPVDITTTSGQNTLWTNLVTGTLVKVYGIPQANGTINSYVLTYFTGFAQATTVFLCGSQRLCGALLVFLQNTKTPPAGYPDWRRKLFQGELQVHLARQRHKAVATGSG